MAKKVKNPPNLDLFGHEVSLQGVRDANDEARRQASIVEYVRWVVIDGTLIWAVPNGGYLLPKATAARLKWTGLLAGVLDLTLALPGGRSAYWETKTRTGRLSDDQKDIIAGLVALGHTWAVVRDIDDARRELARLGVRTREARGERYDQRGIESR